MRNKIIEKAIDEVIDRSEVNSDFKSTFKQFVKNKFDNNANDNDLKINLDILKVDEEEWAYENEHFVFWIQKY